MQGYLDPTSGSMLLQLLLGGISGIYVILRLLKPRILGFFGVHPELSDSAKGVQTVPRKEDPTRRQE